MRRFARRLRARWRRAPAVLKVFLHPGRSQRLLEDLAAENGQLRTVVEESGGRLPPPAHLQRRVVGVYGPEFLEGGKAVAADIRSVLARHEIDFACFSRILDFGCGCGRVSRYLRDIAREAEIVATDIDKEAIEWCRKYYGDLAEFHVNPHVPPTAFNDASFDFVFSVSILTHLPQELQRKWIQELVRITRPGGYLLLTVHGPNHFDKVPRRLRTEFERSGFVYAEGEGTDGLPGFYQTAFHTHEYVKREWSRYVEVASVVPLAISNHQDAVLCRKPLR